MIDSQVDNTNLPIYDTLITTDNLTHSVPLSAFRTIVCRLSLMCFIFVFALIIKTLCSNFLLVILIAFNSYVVTIRRVLDLFNRVEPI